MVDPRRLVAVVLVLASQLLSGFVVLCDEGSGEQFLEMRSECCDAPGPMQSERVSDEGAACSSCRDVTIEASAICVDPVSVRAVDPSVLVDVGVPAPDTTPRALVVVRGEGRDVPPEGATARLRSVVLLR